MKQPTIIITGANGFVGTAMVKHFARKGWNVHAFVYGAHKAKNQKNVTYFEYALGKKFDDQAFKNADYLIHLAYVKEDRKNPNAYKLNIQGTKLLLEKCRQAKLKKTIFMSSMSAHKNAVSNYGKQKFRLEKLFNTRKEAVVRSGLVIGNGGLIKQIVTFMRTKHIAPLIDNGGQPLQVIAIYDLVRVMENILAKNLHGTFTVGTPEVYTYRTFYDIIRRKFHIKVLFLRVPFFVPLLAIRTVNLLRLPIGFTEDNLQGLKKLQAFDTKDDLQKIGVTLDPLEKILARIVIK